MRALNRYLFTLLILSLPGCGRFTYGVDALNYGENGVMILQVGDRKADALHPAYLDLGVTVPMIAGRSPSLPSKYRDPASAFGRFQGYETSLPEEVLVVWQLAALTECKKELRVDAGPLWSSDELNGKRFGRKEYVAKTGCRWHPLPDKIFRQRIDIESIKKSDAYKRTGERYKDVAGSRYTLNITLIFIEENLKFEVNNGATNPWL